MEALRSILEFKDHHDGTNGAVKIYVQGNNLLRRMQLIDLAPTSWTTHFSCCYFPPDRRPDTIVKSIF